MMTMTTTIIAIIMIVIIITTINIKIIIITIIIILGCGKTSVLNTLAGRLPQGGVVSGTILVNGEPRDNDFIKLSAYVL